MSYIALANTTLTSAASSVTFGSIPTSVNGVALRDLVVIVNGTLNNNFGDVYFRFNGSSTNYSNVQMSGSGSATNSGTYDTDKIRINFYAGFNSSTPGNAILQVMDYSATDKHKTTLGRQNSASGASGAGVDAAAGRWASTSAISSIVVFSNGTNTFSSGSTFALYGIAG